MKAQDKIKILHAPTTVGGNPQGLARAERKIGLKSWSVTLHNNYINYSVDEVLFNKKNRFLSEIGRLWFYTRFFYHFDIFHYNFGTTLASPPYRSTKKITEGIEPFFKGIYYYYTNLLEWGELNLLKLLDKPIFVTYQGDDARQGDYCIDNFEISIATEVNSNYYSKKTDEEKRQRIKKFDKFSEKIYAVNPDLLWVLPKRAEFIPYAHIDINSWVPVITKSEKIKLIHAPSHRGAKGTNIILNVIKKLESEHTVNFEFELIEGLSNKDAMERYKKADILIDQLYAGWYGGLAVEFMALGKPVMSYVREKDLVFIPELMKEELPIINVTSDTLYETLSVWLNKPKQQIINQGLKSRHFVEKWHDQEKIAKKLKKDYINSLTKRNIGITIS